MNAEERREVARLVRGQRWAALATVSEGAPHASMVAYVAEPDFGGFLLHLSGLAAHTRQLLADARASLAISEQDPGLGDPQTLARLVVTGSVVLVDPSSPEYEAAARAYVERLPDSEPLFELGDFSLFRLVPTQARYVGGFGRARSLTAEDLRSAAREAQAA